MMLKLGAKSGPKAGWWHFHDALVGTPEAFTTNGALRGSDGTAFDMGQLPENFHESARSATYTVYSYSTPIAWKNEDSVWIVPDVKYSVTTSAHQSKIATAIRQIGVRS